MRFSRTFPDFASIEAHVQRARIERSVYLAEAITDGVMAFARGLKRVVEKIAAQIDREVERRALEADHPFLKRPMHRY